jgi:hypothetical protein
MSALRRYEILLPSQFNDGRPVPPDLIADTLQELEQAFGAVSCETQSIQGVAELTHRLAIPRPRRIIAPCLVRPKTNSSSTAQRQLQRARQESKFLSVYANNLL